MSRSPKQQAPVKPKFDTRPYERPGLSESDILQIKEIFDMFDREHTGSIHPRGNPSFIQKSSNPWLLSATKPKASPFISYSSILTLRGTEILLLKILFTYSLRGFSKTIPEKTSTKYSPSSITKKRDLSVSKT